VRVASSQYNYLYGDQLHYPYSVGCLLSYANVDTNELLPTFVLRDRLSEHIEVAAKADVLLASCYVWNWQITMRLIDEAKKKNPSLLVVCGGPQVPDRADGFFAKYPLIDALVHGEGEVTLSGLLSRWQAGQSIGGPGVTTREGNGGPAERINDLAPLDSPYLSGMLDKLTAGTEGVKWVASWETNRGCPYMCTFCDWGSLTYTKLRQYPMDRLLAEIAWMSERQIGYIDCCDANFGMLPRDKILAEHLKEKALGTGWPRTFRQSWAKNSNERVIEIAKELKKGGLLTAVGLAVQSLDEKTLDIIKRKNLQMDRFSDLTKQFADAGLPTYTEVIRGLPGETLDSFKRGLGELVAHSDIGTIAIYNCGVLPNAPMAEPEYVKKHGIQTVHSPIYLGHSSVEARGVDEYEEIIYATNTMPAKDMLEAFMFSWAILVGESLGLCSHVRRYFERHGVSCVRFYELLLEDCRSHNGPWAHEYTKARLYALNGYAGKGWDHHDPEWGPIFWPIEEASWLRLVTYGRGGDSWLSTVDHLTVEYWRMLVRMIYRMKHDEPKPLHVPMELVKEQVDMMASLPEGMDKFEWAKETVWYGRRRGAYLKTPVGAAA
jgi:2-(S-pantetheinyl)-carbapenam-3-carboxylate methyltransferase